MRKVDFAKNNLNGNTKNSTRQMRFTLVLLIAFWVRAEAQIVRGVIKDASTKQPLAYVHVGVFNKNMGVISHENGEFEIDLSHALPDDELGFSMIGHETKKVRVENVGNEYLEIQLTPKQYMLKEVIVRDRKKETKKLGRTQPSKWTTGQSGKTDFGFGGEWGLRINHEGKKYWLNDVQFHLRYNTADSVLYRIQIYSIKDNLPFESLLKKDLFVKSYKNKKWIIAYCEDQQIQIDQDVIVTFEFVRWWVSKSGENRLFTTHGVGYEQGKTYYRQSSQDAWSINTQPPITMFMTVEEYDK